MTSQERRPEQGKFGKEETTFLKTHLPAYAALCDHLSKQATGPRGTGSVKGSKKEWILSKVFPEFVKRFSSDQHGGPQLESLQVKLLRWFANHAPHRSSGSRSTPLTNASPIKRPRAINGAEVFAKEHRAKITERMAEQQDLEGGTSKQVNLPRYYSIKKELYNQLTDAERCAYNTKAAETNEANKAPPETSRIFENQRDIVGGVVMALDNLAGWGWGQYGEVVFFVQGAYRNAENDLKTFNVSVTPNTKTTSFSSTLPDYKETLRAPFREWAENALPVPLDRAADIAADPKYAIDLEEDGHPRFPVVNIDHVAPNDARLMLRTYIELTWKFTTMSAFVQELELETVPWDLLDAISLRRKLLVNPEVFSHVKSLDPMQMSPPDVYAVLVLLLKGQESGLRLLEFSIEDIFNSEPDAEPDAERGFDPPTVLCDPPSVLRRDLSIDSMTAEIDKDISMPDPSLPPISAPATCVPSPVPSPVIDADGAASQSSPPPVSISDATVIQQSPNPNQALHLVSRQSGKAKASSNSKKRKREEQGPNEDKKMKKQAVPIREQSSRLKDTNYRNKHVTVRPR